MYSIEVDSPAFSFQLNISWMFPYKDELGPSSSTDRNNKLKDCLEKLQQIAKLIDQRAIFSANESVQDLSTNSLSLLLVPAYTAYVIEEVNVERERRSRYLKAAEAYYHQFLEAILNYDLISFRLPWLNVNESELSSVPSIQEKILDVAEKRQQKISRLNQLRRLEEALTNLRIQQRRNNDEATEREALIVLIRLWSVRAFAQLEKIDEELELVKYHEKHSRQRAPLQHESEEKPLKNSGVKTFTIVRSEEQKKVFGLGYPSLPTVTVDEWFDELSARSDFGKEPLKTLTMMRDDEGPSSSTDDDNDDEQKRMKQMERDGWKDDHRRGWGNTYNKG
uniref:Immunoglobulin-binding protein 1 n=1 Tax=Ditylenchus dipsaci TaxID=166011 RepID=A0A915EDT6_9BILA